MTAVGSRPQVRADDGTIYVFEDVALFEALVAATARALEQFDDAALLSQRQQRLVILVRRIVWDTLRREMPGRIAARNRRHLSRALSAYITYMVRQRQGQAFERRLAKEFGPLEPVDPEDLERQMVVVKGIRVVAVDPVRVDERTGRE